MFAFIISYFFNILPSFEFADSFEKPAETFFGQAEKTSETIRSSKINWDWKRLSGFTENI